MKNHPTMLLWVVLIMCILGSKKYLNDKKEEKLMQEDTMSILSKSAHENENLFRQPSKLNKKKLMRSQYKYVKWCTNGLLWEARPYFEGKATYAGQFKSEKDAGKAVDLFLIKHKAEPVNGFFTKVASVK